MTEIDKLEELAKAAAVIDHNENPGWYSEDELLVTVGSAHEVIGYPKNARHIAACDPSTILRLVRVARAAKVILAHHDEGARPDQIALDELRAALSVQNTVQVSGKEGV
jgi:hypothetical protein